MSVRPTCRTATVIFSALRVRAALLVCVVGALDAHAQGPSATTPLELIRLNAPITLDGVPNEPVWQNVPTLPLTMYGPVFRGTPTQRSEIRVSYDDQHLYVAGWMYDTDPSGIRVNSLYRDRWNGDDALAIYVDGFNDDRNAKWFGVTAGGVRFDQLVSDDGATLNESWDAFWSARTTITADGWFVEVRIPFASIGIRSAADGSVSMGLTVTRLVSRLGERVTFPAIDPKFEFRRPSVAQDITLRDLQVRRPLYVTPYLLTGASRFAVPLVAGTPQREWRRATEREAGLDLRYSPTSTLTVDLTANTDFAQVEVDEQQVNLDRFPLFFPERRRFFQEGSGTFDFTAGGGTRLFNSRRIGLARDLTPVRILGGARVVGRLGHWDVGLLGMQTQRQDSVPAESFGVARVRRSVLNPSSAVGLMLTSYTGGGVQNLALGLDGTFRLLGNEQVTLKLSETTDSRDSSTSFTSRNLIDFRWERRAQRGLWYAITGTRLGRDYRPEVGFLQRRDYTLANVVTNWYVYTDRHRWLRRYYPGALAFHTFRNADHALESGQYAFWVQWDTKAGGGGWIEPKWFVENVARPFTIGDVEIPVGEHRFRDLQLYLFMSSGSKVRTALDVRSGTFYDGTRTQVIVTPTWNVSPHLELGADYQLTHLEFRRRRQYENVHLGRLRIRTALDARASGNVFLQYSSTARRLDANVRLRYAFSEGTDLWLVYNEGLETEAGTLEYARTALPRSLARTVLIKYSHTLGL